jgi:hypothetical protein
MNAPSSTTCFIHEQGDDADVLILDGWREVPMQEIQWAAFPTPAMVLRTAY